MKLSRILALVVSSAAAGIFGSTFPVYALTYNWTFDGLANTGGTFEESGGLITSWSGTVDGENITELLLPDTVGANNNQYPLDLNGVSFSTASFWYNLSLDNFDGFYYLDKYDIEANEPFDRFTGNSFNVTSVPFNIPGGATVPSIGFLFALALMRKAKKRMALKSQPH